MKNARVIIVDDEADIREGLQGWLSNDYSTLCFDSAESFLAAINNFDFEDGAPSCMLLDFQMPGMNGVELQSALKQINIEFPIIFMSGNAGQADIINAWHGGAIDFILKPFIPQQICEALTKLFAQHERDKVITSGPQSGITDIPITTREAQVLLLLGKGHQQKEIAEMLGLSLRTVKMYRTILKNKLNLNTLMEIARYCDQYHLSIQKIAANNTVEMSTEIGEVHREVWSLKFEVWKNINFYQNPTSFESAEKLLCKKYNLFYKLKQNNILSNILSVSHSLENHLRNNNQSFP